MADADTQVPTVANIDHDCHYVSNLDRSVSLTTTLKLIHTTYLQKFDGAVRQSHQLFQNLSKPSTLVHLIARLS